MLIRDQEYARNLLYFKWNSYQIVTIQAPYGSRRNHSGTPERGAGGSKRPRLLVGGAGGARVPSIGGR